MFTAKDAYKDAVNHFLNDMAPPVPASPRAPTRHQIHDPASPDKVGMADDIDVDWHLVDGQREDVLALRDQLSEAQRQVEQTPASCREQRGPARQRLHEACRRDSARRHCGMSRMKECR